MIVTSVNVVEAKEFTTRVFKLFDKVRSCTVIIFSVAYNIILRVYYELFIMLSNKSEPSVKYIYTIYDKTFQQEKFLGSYSKTIANI